MKWRNVRYWHIADMPFCTAHVRFWGKAEIFERRGISPATDRRCDVVVYAGFGEPIYCVRQLNTCALALPLKSASLREPLACQFVCALSDYSTR